MIRDYADIIRRNVLTPFVLIIAIVVAVLLVLGRRSDALFLASTITLNSLVGIFQEARAQARLRKLELLSQTQVRRHTHFGYELITFEAIQVGDHIELHRGDQIPADGVIISAKNCTVNESLLTGEGQEISRHKGDSLLAGTAVITGSALLEVTAIGTATRAGQINASLHQYEQRLSPLQRDLAEILRWLTYLSLLAAVVIIVNGHVEARSINDIVSMVVAGAITLVPEGLVLAATLLFTYGAIRIAQEGVLVQHLASLEGFGRLKTLCLDKTGTLTESTMDLEELHPIFPYPEHRVKEYLAAFLASEEDPSPSLAALAQHLSENRLAFEEIIPFSSSRKYSAISLVKDRCLMLGAPEIVSRKAPLNAALEKKIQAYSLAGFRVMLLADFGPVQSTLAETLEGTGKPVGYIVLRNRLRANSIDTVFYLQARGVSLRVISGDAPGTVQAIAQQVGILNPEKVITGSELAELDETEWIRQIPTYTVFARILPEQKERIISTFRRKGFTGMVGDGVNDALALKQADLSIAMLEGSGAAREVADIVLSENDFGAFPAATRLAGRIILGLQMVACAFFNKVAYGLVLLLWTLFFDISFPFTARHLILITYLAIGLPTLLWSFIPPDAAYRLSPRHFFGRVAAFAIPNGTVTALAVISLSLLCRIQGYMAWETGAFLIVLSLGVLSFRLIPRFLHAVDSGQQRRVQGFYFAFCVMLVAALSQLPFVRSLFQLDTLQLLPFLDTLLIIFIAGWCQLLLVRRHTQTIIEL